VVEVAGCGVCHTDLSFLHHGVKTRGELPLVLGHEISGIVRQMGRGPIRRCWGVPSLSPLYSRAANVSSAGPATAASVAGK
jgi:6-hydroxycyclohex-1-ene-1-carbonyl-CoA dehydrogenase